MFNAVGAPPRLAELIGGLTVATDLGAGVPAESALRTSLLAAHIARAAGLETAEVSAAYWAGLLRYLGCSGFAHETAPLGNGDDQAVLATFEAADPARAAEVIGLAVGRLGRGGGRLARAAAVARFLAAPDMPQKLADARAALTPDAAARTLRGEAEAGRLCGDAAGWVLAAAGQGAAAPRASRNLPAGLTEREAEVLQLLARGLSNKQMARELFVSPITIKDHVAHIYEKAGVGTRAAAALFAVQHRLV